MALISVMIGGFGGFFSFLAALVMGFGLVSSLALYAAVAVGIAASVKALRPEPDTRFETTIRFNDL